MAWALSTGFVPHRLRRQELLDDSPAHEAVESLRDLRRINRWFGGHRLLRKLLAEQVSPDQPFTFLEIGGGSGDNCAEVARSFPLSRVTLLDYRLVHARQASGMRVVADAFAPPFRGPQFDFVFSSLFLHQFNDLQIEQLLRGMYGLARRAVLVTDLERHRLAYETLPATRWLFGWHAITLHDGPASVQAGFQPQELLGLAKAAELPNPQVRRHRPWFRLSLVSRRVG